MSEINQPGQLYVNSPPEAYSAVLPEAERRTLYAEDPLKFEPAEVVSARLQKTFEDARTGVLGEDRKQLLEDEMSLFGLSEGCTSEEFWAAHHELTATMDSIMTEVLSESKNVVVNSLASRLASEEHPEDETRVLLQGRIAEMWTEVNDGWRNTGRPLNLSRMAYYNSMHKMMALNLPKVIGAINHENLQKADMIDYISQLSRHEVMHGAFAVWYDTERAGTGIISNGIELHEPERNGTWLNEGTIEKYRRDNFGSENFGFSYETSVAVLDVADTLDPGFEDARLKAAVFNEGRGEMIGRLEMLFGPMAVERLHETISKVSKIAELDAFKDEVVSMLAEKDREKAREVLDETLASVLARSKDE